jgi:DNA-binding NarL/FixJ family response regulator
MSQWGVQLAIGKLLTDEEFRRRFEQRRRECLTGLRERGVDLNDAEIAALVEADPRVWSTMAERIDRRLQDGRVRPEPQGQPAHRPLTEREQHVLRGVFEGLTNKQIAADIGVSEGAVKATLQHLFRKTRVRTRAQLVRVAIEGSLGAIQSRR